MWFQVENCICTYNAEAYVVVYSVVDAESVRVAEDILHFLWRSDVVSTHAVILVGNKIDLARSRVVSFQGNCISIGFSPDFYFIFRIFIGFLFRFFFFPGFSSDFYFIFRIFIGFFAFSSHFPISIGFFGISVGFFAFLLDFSHFHRIFRILIYKIGCNL